MNARKIQFRLEQIVTGAVIDLPSLGIAIELRLSFNVTRATFYLDYVVMNYDDWHQN
jgi:hypothetical protein